MENNNVIQAKKITKAFGNRTLFSSLDVNVEEKSCLGIIGRNGCGKTTLINILTGAMKPSEGTISYSFPRQELPWRIGVQMQNGYFDEMLKLKEICRLYSNIYGLPYSHAEELIEMFELSQVQDTNLTKLSGGERQKLNILLAVLHDPKVLFFDEITTGLDAITRRDLYVFLKKLRDEARTIVWVSHYFEELYQLASHVLIFLPSGQPVLHKTSSLGRTYEEFKDQILTMLGGDTLEVEKDGRQR